MIIPAIDLQNGEAVRLFQGDYAQKTVYSQDPVALAAGFEEMGARYLHVVDLDGAKGGSTANIETIRNIRAAIDIPIQVGGGIRNAETVSCYLDEIGVDRVILGTVAVENPDFVRKMVAKHGAKRIVVGVDVRDGIVKTAGWQADSGVQYLGFIEQMKDCGVQYLIVTDIAKDGTLTAPSWDLYESIKGIHVIVSGGVSCADDIRRGGQYYGVIVGKAYYEGKVDLPQILQEMDAAPPIDGLIPAIVQDFYTGRVLMLAYVNQEAYDYMRQYGETCFWSRSRQKLWHKGETSGNVQRIRHIAFDCDDDTLLIQVEQTGKGACHTGAYSCFGAEHGAFYVLQDLYEEIIDRVQNPKEKSYTNYLLREGVDKICKKVAEEAAETIIAAKNRDKPEFIAEISDLTYHLLVLMFEQDATLRDVTEKLAARRTVAGNLKEKRVH